MTRPTTGRMEATLFGLALAGLSFSGLAQAAPPAVEPIELTPNPAPALAQPVPEPEPKPAPGPAPEPAPEPAPLDVDDADVAADLGDLLGTSVVQTASRADEDESTAPATMTVVTAEQLRLYGLYTISDVVQYFGLGISYQPTGGETGTVTTTARGVAIDGDGNNHVLVLVNGHKVNDSWGGWVYFDDRLGLPLELIDRVEIINGPGSVLYGTSAMYGVINIVIKEPQAYEGLHVVGQGRVLLPGDAENDLTGAAGQNALGWGTRASVGYGHALRIGDRDGGVFFQVERIDHRDPTHVFGPQGTDWDPGPNTWPDGSWGGYGAGRRSITAGMFGFRLGDWALDLKGGFWERNHIADYQADFNDPQNFEWQGDARFDLRHRAHPKAGVELRTRVFGDVIPYSASWIYTDVDGWCPNLAGRCRSLQKDTSSIYGAEEVITWDWFVNQKAVSLFGVDIRGRTVRDVIDTRELATGTSANLDFANYLATTAAGSLFVQQTWRPVERFGLNAGARLDVDQLFGAHVSPRAALMVHPWRQGTLKLMYSEAFRAPSAGEVFFKDPTYSIQAEDLEAEVVRSLELTGEHQLPSGRGRIRAGSFVSWWLGLVGERGLTDEEFQEAIDTGELVPDADQEYSVVYDNTEDIFAFGGFLSADLQSPDGKVRFGTNVSLTESWANVDGDRQPIARVPDWIVNARTAYVPGGFFPSPALVLLYNSPRRTSEDVGGDFVVADRAEHHVQGRFTLSGDIPKTHGLKYRLAADYSLGRYGPYSVGQLQYSEDATFRGELAPLDRLSIWLGLRWDFDLGPPESRR